MRILRIIAENVKRLKILDITPNEYINRISGANGSGKTSALDAIEWLLTGTSTVPSQPVRKGAGRSVIQGDLGEIIVTRRFTEGGPRNGTLLIESKSDRSTLKSPQTVLDNYMGKFSFDPLEFLRMPPDKQLEVLKSLVKLEIDLDELEKAYQADYLRRREAKKEKVAVETRRDAVYVAPNLPKVKIDEAALVQQLEEASSFNSEIARKQEDRNAILKSQDEDTQTMKAKVGKIAELQAEIARLQGEVKEDGNHLARSQRVIEKWEPLPELRNAADLAAQITAARTVNQGIDRRTLRDNYQKEADVLETEIAALNTANEERERIKTEALTKAEFPVPGLAFGEGEVIYRGFPFNQVSNAEQIRCAVAIGMATNPELRVMRIKDGSLLDDKAMEIIAEMAIAHDVQVWVEVVDTSGKVGIYLEDGEVVTVNDEPLNKPKAARKAEEPAPVATPKKRAKK